ncbi:sensor histidine kinase [Actinomadura chibensis]|uniref:sensor histidine kinase n=1 Tax=Actinomadura chibensis TaxID=392828 RepID=UPI000AAF2BA2|nr:HAMP domain-containing sensor histidine kinase [Actinomadura chibensis]
MIRRLSLRVRLLLLTAGLLLAGLVLLTAVLSNRLQANLLGRMDGQLRSLATIVALAPNGDKLGTPRSPQVLGPALELLGTPYLVLLDGNGTVVDGIHAPREGRGALPPPSELRRVRADGSPVTLAAGDGSQRWRAIGLPRRDATGPVIAAASLADVDATVGNVRTSGLVGGTVLLTLLTVAGWFALGGGLRPLRKVEHTAAAIAEGDLTRRVPELAASGTEVGRLARSLNTMLGQLERAFADRAASEARMRNFVSDVSHELRTPLFGIKGSTELYQMGGSDADATIRRIDREAARLTVLTEDLLFLAQLDQAPESQLDPAPMDLRTLANDARHDLRSLDPTRPVELTGPDGGPPGAAPVNGDEARLRQVVTNLVGNAVAHTPSGTPVRIGVGVTGDRAILEVADEGPGIGAEQASRVFDRFYRADRSRDRSAGANAGLGLAIARSLARAHGGDIELETSLGKGARFRLTLPAQDR